MARILITSALPYINGVKHLGNLAGSMLPADVYARFNRAMGHEVLFICATDEHGTPAELAAIEVGQTTAQYCDEQHDIQKRVGAGFSLSFDHFGRSSNRPNRAATTASVLIPSSQDQAACPAHREAARTGSLAHRRSADCKPGTGVRDMPAPAASGANRPAA